MIFPFTKNLFDILIDLFGDFVPGMKSLMVAAGLESDYWIVDTEGILVWTGIFFVIGLIIGYFARRK